MGESVRKLDTSGWPAEALERQTRYAAEAVAHREALAIRAERLGEAQGHPWAGIWSGLSPEAQAASAAAKIIVKAKDWGNGHREFVATLVTPDPEKALERAVNRLCGVPSAPPEEVDKAANVERSVRRAKQQVRHLCKGMAVNSLWTLTYRANVTDRDTVVRHLDRFRRRVANVLPEWRYLAVLERQERGAYHIHIATHALPSRLVQGGVKVKSWDVMRAIWRAVVGDLGGNFDEAKRSRRWSSGKRPIKGSGAIARYLAGYVAKDMLDSPENRKRFSHSMGLLPPASYRALFPADTPWVELIELAYAHCGERITGAWFDADRGVFFLESDDSPGLS